VTEGINKYSSEPKYIKNYFVDLSRQYRKLSARAVPLMLRQNYSFELGKEFLYVLVIGGANLNGSCAVQVWWYLDGSQNQPSYAKELTE